MLFQKQKQTELYLFYKDYRPNIQGKYLSDIWRYDDITLEHCHNYIQWLFPLSEKSDFNHEAPLIDKSFVKAFSGEEMMSLHMLKSLSLMLSFYGFELIGGNTVTVVKSSDYLTKNKVWLNRNNHNFLRITRILRCLTLVGLRDYALAFLSELTEVYNENPEVIGSTSFNFWQEAVDDESEQNKLAQQQFGTPVADYDGLIIGRLVKYLGHHELKFL